MHSFHLVGEVGEHLLAGDAFLGFCGVRLRNPVECPVLLTLLFYEKLLNDSKAAFSLFDGSVLFLFMQIGK